MKPFIIKEEFFYAGKTPIYHVFYAEETKSKTFEKYSDAIRFKKTLI